MGKTQSIPKVRQRNRFFGNKLASLKAKLVQNLITDRGDVFIYFITLVPILLKVIQLVNMLINWVLGFSSPIMPLSVSLLLRVNQLVNMVFNDIRYQVFYLSSYPCSCSFSHYQYGCQYSIRFFSSSDVLLVD